MLDVAGWMTNLGRFAIATGTLPTLLNMSRTAAATTGVVLLIALPLVGALARRRGGAWTLPAVGLAIFITALLPVLPLTLHFFYYFIGIAALGMVLAVIGICRLLPQGGAVVAAALLAGTLVADRVTCDRAGQADSAVLMMRSVQAKSLQLLRDIYLARAQSPDRWIHIDDSPLNMSVIGFGGASQVFFDPPVHVQYGPCCPLFIDPVQLVPATDDVPVPGADARWDWLRHGAATLHAHYAASCGG